MAKASDKTRRNPEFVFVIAGEPTLVNAKCTELVDRLVSPQEKTTGLWVADADKVTISEVLDELRTLPFLSKKRVVVLRNADKFISARGQQDDQDEEDEQDKQDGQGAPAGSSNRQLLEKYFENPCPTGILVLTVSKWDGKTRLAKKLPEVGTLIEAKPPKAAELPRRLINYARDAYNKGLDYGAAQLLVELAGDNLPRLYTEVDKLAAYSANEKSITTAHVESLVGHNRLFDAFKVIDACLQKNIAQAVERLRSMFEADKSTEYTVVGAFAYHFRRLFAAKKMLQEGYSQNDIVGKLRMWYNKESQFTLLKRLSLKQIGDQIQQLAETDYAIKKGLAQPRIAIELLVLRLCSI
ncbi:MAG: DNA polymerase III subunit delta [Sedimentisphaerales bacterium]|nr:DNA polymerase III subunit delta [Sedimentisphaerales bacterium]